MREGIEIIIGSLMSYLGKLCEIIDLLYAVD